MGNPLFIAGPLVVVVACALLVLKMVLWLKQHESAGAKEPCRNCGYDLQASHERCPECATLFRRRRDPWPLRDDLPAEPCDLRTPASHEVPVTIFEADEHLVAHLLVRQLDARGIPAEVQGDPPAPDLITGLSPPGGPYGVIVWSADEDKARALVHQLMPEPRDRLGYTH